AVPHLRLASLAGRLLQRNLPQTDMVPSSLITLSALLSIEANPCETAKPRRAAEDVLADRANCS
uniref:hypothetical protein n=1 Tax=Bradyrhizobium sp. sBnM-33 TaxID=2831780 RepID=UPI001BCE8571